LEQKIPTFLIKAVYEEWIIEYGPTFPLYGNDTKRSDISGSIRPLLSSTEISHIKVLAAITGLSKKKLENIISGKTEQIDFDLADKLLSAMQMQEKWWDGPLADYY
jgi:hypothetical protein